MVPEMVNKFIVMLALVCTVLVFVKILYQAIRNKCTKVKTEKAQVIDKFKEDKFAKLYSSAVKAPQYFVVFQVGNQKKTFRVSEFSYAGYTVGERGALKYRGDKLVDFR